MPHQLTLNSTALDKLKAKVQTLPNTGESSGGVEYEIITIPAGATTVSYSLPRVTAAYGTINEYLLEYKGTGGFLSIRNDILYYINYISGNSPVRIETSSILIRYENGVMKIDGPGGPNDMEVILVNDPSAPAISF